MIGDIERELEYGLIKNQERDKLCNKKCGNMVGSLHKTNLGNADRIKRANILNVNKYNTTTQQDRYRIPEELIYSLFID